ncbi:hypothetical protein VRK_04850 [Vibrio sp. MEBiC08052]|nr:hypothetical protein VRK_04850 [Vibrio sp. MEBiC08052]
MKLKYIIKRQISKLNYERDLIQIKNVKMKENYNKKSTQTDRSDKIEK